MVAGMAMAFYGWDRDALRNEVTAEIASDLQRVGLLTGPRHNPKVAEKERGPHTEADP